MKIGNLKNMNKPMQPKKGEALPPNTRHVKTVSWDLNQVAEIDDIDVDVLADGLQLGKTVLLDNFYKNSDGTSNRKKVNFKETNFFGIDSDDVGNIPEDTAFKLEEIGLEWFVWYYSFSSVLDALVKEDNKYKHRFFIKFDEYFNEVETIAMYNWLETVLPGIIDPNANDYARLWFGTNKPITQEQRKGKVNKKADYLEILAPFIKEVEDERTAMEARREERETRKQNNIDKKAQRTTRKPANKKTTKFTGDLLSGYIEPTDDDYEGFYFDEPDKEINSQKIYDVIDYTLDEIHYNYGDCRELMLTLSCLESCGYFEFMEYFLNTIEYSWQDTWAAYVEDQRKDQRTTKSAILRACEFYETPTEHVFKELEGFSLLSILG